MGDEDAEWIERIGKWADYENTKYPPIVKWTIPNTL